MGTLQVLPDNFWIARDPRAIRKKRQLILQVLTNSAVVPASHVASRRESFRPGRFTQVESSGRNPGLKLEVWDKIPSPDLNFAEFAVKKSVLYVGRQ